MLRSVGWFGYLDGAELRDNCQPAAPPRYRLVYNAVWGRQVRDYEIVTDPATGALTLNTRILFPEAPGEMDLRDPLRTFRGQHSAQPLSAADLAELDASLAESGFNEPTPSGLNLPSDGYYWVVAACRNGVFHYNAYLYPSPRFAALRFPDWLYARDHTGVAVASPGPSEARDQQSNRNLEPRGYSVFDLRVGDNGLWGLPDLF
jgi:hypothetical protein